MNYLAHAYLSFNHAGILTGNMISDFVKGKKKFDYPPAVQKGIELHRMIDRFTDEHDSTREAKKVFSPVYRLYSGAFVDVVYDYFLATDPAEFENEKTLFEFSIRTYAMLKRDEALFPEKFARLFPYMVEQNWLYNYRSRPGIEKSMGGVVRRAAYLTESDTAFQLFEEHYQLLKDCYRQFWADLRQYTRHQLQYLITQP